MKNHSTFNTQHSTLLKTFEESLGNIERSFSHLSPEVEILLCLGIFQRYIADDADGAERSLVDMEGMGDSAALHIQRNRLTEVFQDRANLLLAVYKPFADNHLSGVALRVNVARQVVDGECLIHIFLRCFAGSRHDQNLSEFALLAAVGIVVNAVG